MLVLITTKMLDPHICMKIYPKKFDVTNFDNFALTKKKKKVGEKSYKNKI